MGLAKQNMADHNAEDNAAAYESDLRAEDQYQRTDNTSAQVAVEMARRMGILGTASSMAQFNTGAAIQARPQSILPAILSGVMGASGALLGNPAVFGG